ncbi:MAG: glycosyltransferase [Kiritimatiellae bacterium]|nr:glycosyltransferase [Kiritimatiellia bacterium]
MFQTKSVKHGSAPRAKASTQRKKLALWFRYGPSEHAELFHALPRLIEILSGECELHYFGMQSAKPVPTGIAELATIHHLPWRVNRASVRDKTLKTILWYFCIPWIAFRCRRLAINAVFVDETLPGLAWLGRLFFGRNIAMMVADFFGDVYLGKVPWLAPLKLLIRAIDFAAWRRLPLIFTRTHYTTRILTRKGLDPARMHVVYDPCDTSLFYPIANKADSKRRFGFLEKELILVHHGILHPNKGNDRIIRALSSLRTELPDLRFLLVGSGPDEARLRALCKSLDMEGIVRFTGWLPSAGEVNLALNAADIGLVMRVGHESDNFHVTGALVHSMACGLPVLAARLGGVAEIVREGENGLLFDPTDMNEFAAKLRLLAGEPLLRKRLGEAAYHDALRLFDVEAVAQQTAGPLLSLLGISSDMVRQK